MINVAVMGYGTVGSGVVEVLRTNGELINERAQDVIRSGSQRFSGRSGRRDSDT